MTFPEHPAPAPPAAPTCYRHPDRETYVRCVRCDRPICPDCMHAASVGFQCPDDVKAGNAGIRAARTTFGGRVSADAGRVTFVLIGVSVAAYVAQIAVGNNFTDRLLLVAGPFQGPEGFRGVAGGEFYRLLSAAFLHGSPFHLLANMYALFLIGPQLEALFGRSRYLALYFLSALGGSAASYLISAPTQQGLGASGAVFGLFAAYFVVSKRLSRDVRSIVTLLAINLVIGFVIPQIDWRAHLGGLITGGLVAFAFAYAPTGPRRDRLQAFAAAGVLGLVLVIIALRTATLTA